MFIISIGLLMNLINNPIVNESDNLGLELDLNSDLPSEDSQLDLTSDESISALISDLTSEDLPSLTPAPEHELSIKDPEIYVPIILAAAALVAALVGIIICFKKYCPSCLPCLLC